MEITIKNSTSIGFKIWRVGFKKLKDDGSFVVDFGGAYMKGVPVRSVYNFRVLIRMIDEVGFHLAEDFYWFNPSKLPSPIEWVNKESCVLKILLTQFGGLAKLNGQSLI